MPLKTIPVLSTIHSWLEFLRSLLCRGCRWRDKPGTLSCCCFHRPFLPVDSLAGGNYMCEPNAVPSHRGWPRVCSGIPRGNSRSQPRCLLGCSAKSFQPRGNDFWHLHLFHLLRSDSVPLLNELAGYSPSTKKLENMPGKEFAVTSWEWPVTTIIMNIMTVTMPTVVFTLYRSPYVGLTCIHQCRGSHVIDLVSNWPCDV